MRIAVALWVAGPMLAQTGADLSIPDSPAVRPTVVRPATPREFVVSLLNGFDHQGVAIDFAPYWLAAGHLVGRQIYKANPIVRLLAGIQVSLATTKSPQAAESSRFGAGLQIRIWDRGDARLDDTLANCLQKAAERVLAASPPCREGDTCTEENARRETLLKSTCREEARARNWNRSSWAVGGSKDAQSDTAGAWSSLAYGFEGVPGLEKTSQFILQLTRRSHDLAGGLRLRTGGADTQVSIEWIGAGGQSQFSLAAERRVGENLWLELTVGGVSSKRIFALTSFHWGLARQ